ncbi:MAG TPA: aminotransferase class III-fold pyridoxal phosphate-dependent enzyme, partial [Castellaniella sp.]|nr:aminotransferase class III-fold pyridoxal phosphate-dependent enzyme [Castellaniella sp.]
GHATACAGALAVQRVIERDGLLANVLARGQQLRARLHEALGDHPNVGDIRGRGLFTGIELVADKADKSVLDPARKTHALLKRQGMANGLMIYPMGGTIDGVHGDHILLAPPFICTAADIDEIVERLARTVQDVLPA